MAKREASERIVVITHYYMFVLCVCNHIIVIIIIHITRMYTCIIVVRVYNIVLVMIHIQRYESSTGRIIYNTNNNFIYYILYYASIGLGKLQRARRRRPDNNNNDLPFHSRPCVV